MKSSRIGLICIIIIAGALASTGCINKLFARNELIESEKAYKGRKLDKAEERARTALRWDASSDTAQLFVARIVRAQFKPGVETPENIAKGQQAIDEYKKVLAIFEGVLKTNPNDPRAQKYSEEAFRQISALLEAMKKEEEQDAWLAQRAADEGVPPSQRSESLTVLASKKHKCSNDITENNKQTVTKDEKATFIYVKPKEAGDYEKAVKCSQEGLDLAQKAVDLDKNNEIAWSYKGNLLLEQSHLAEMASEKQKIDDAKKQAEEALKEYTRLNEIKRNKREAEEAAKKAAEAEANK